MVVEDIEENRGKKILTQHRTKNEHKTRAAQGPEKSHNNPKSF